VEWALHSFLASIQEQEQEEVNPNCFDLYCNLKGMANEAYCIGLQ
jgi:hypothetical protein